LKYLVFDNSRINTGKYSTAAQFEDQHFSSRINSNLPLRMKKRASRSKNDCLCWASCHGQL